MSEEIKLLPCPFCGGEARWRKVEGDSPAPYWVECVDCDCTGPDAPNRAEIVAAWNHRAHDGDGWRDIESAVERLFEAEAAVTAWTGVVESLEAHIMDRAAMDDPAKPETYLSILRGDVARIKESTAAIVRARWTQYNEQQATIERLSAEKVELLNDIAVMMSEFVDNWPQPKKVSTALALIAKTLRAALGKDASDG